MPANSTLESTPTMLHRAAEYVQLRPKQLSPPGDWRVWMLMAGRGFGKGKAGSNWLAGQAIDNPGMGFVAVGPTYRDCRDTMTEGPSGLRSALGPALKTYNRSIGELTLTNGATIWLVSADEPDRLRGKNLAGAWLDEFASFRRPDELWTEALVPALRIGDPKVCVTTTPKPLPLLVDLLSRDDGSVVITTGSTFENSANLSPEAIAELERRYEGTRVGRQELYGELLEDVEGALWASEMFAHSVAPEREDLARVVVAVDPAGTSKDSSDLTGIVVCGEDSSGALWVLDDRSGRFSPSRWATVVGAAYREWEADVVVAEVNMGWDLVVATLRAHDDGMPVVEVRATRGKRVRAEPIVALYEQGKVWHAHDLDELEAQLTSWVPDGGGKSPDRLDAAVWGLTHLMGGGGGAGHAGPSWIRGGGTAAPQTPETTADEDDSADAPRTGVGLARAGYQRTQGRRF